MLKPPASTTQTVNQHEKGARKRRWQHDSLFTLFPIHRGGAGADADQSTGEAADPGIPGLQPVLFLGDFPACQVPGGMPTPER